MAKVINVRKEKRKPTCKTFRSLKYYTCERFCDILLAQTPILNNIISTDDVDIQVDIVTNVLSDSIDAIAPEDTIIITRPPAPWINQDIKDAIEERDRMRDQLIVKENSQLRESYKNKKKISKERYYQKQS